MDGRFIVMLGVSLDTPGGMTSVIRTLRDAELFERCSVQYLSTYETRSVWRQLCVVSLALLQFGWLLLCHRVALLHVHSASRGSFWRKSMFCLVAVIFGVPYVFHIHSGEFPVFYANECSELAQRWIRRTLRRAARVVCLTETWRASILEIEPRAEVTIVGNPVLVLDHLTPLREPPREVLFLGRLREKKGIFDLVSAMPRVLEVCPQLRFVLAGDEGTEEVLAKATDLGVAHALELPGWVDGKRKKEYLARADIFVLPSYFEGLPLGLLEAMAEGIPILSTRVGGIPDVVEDGVEGILVVPGDIEALIAALVTLASNVGLRERLRHAAFERVQSSFSTAVIVASFEELFRSLGVLKGVGICNAAGCITQGQK